MKNIIDFPLDETVATETLFYRPWSTRTLKLSLRTSKAMPALRIRPSHIRPQEQARRLFRGFATDSEAIMISWGGGHEPGPCAQADDYLGAFEKCVPLAPNTEARIFFNISHIGPDVPAHATITFEAFVEETGEVMATRTIQLQRPTGYKDTAVQFIQPSAGYWHPKGTLLPIYDPRWWPREVAYTQSQAWPLTIQQQANTLHILWANEEVATIKDHTNPSILDVPEMMQMELFEFDTGHIALRIWFFWLNAAIGPDRALGGHEVPDAERFDLLLNKKDGTVTLACTDLHWREVWGIVAANQPLRASIGLSKEVILKLAQEKLGKLWGTWKREKTLEHQRSYNPIRYIERLAESIHQDNTVRGKGSEAHLPALLNVTQIIDEGRPPRMTSSDVRLG